MELDLGQSGLFFNFKDEFCLIDSPIAESPTVPEHSPDPSKGAGRETKKNSKIIEITHIELNNPPGDSLGV